MTKPMNVRKFAHLLQAQQELAELERVLKLSGDRRAARKAAAVQESLMRALAEEQIGLYEKLVTLI